MAVQTDDLDEADLIKREEAVRKYKVFIKETQRMADQLKAENEGLKAANGKLSVQIAKIKDETREQVTQEFQAKINDLMGKERNQQEESLRQLADKNFALELKL